MGPYYLRPIYAETTISRMTTVCVPFPSFVSEDYNQSRCGRKPRDENEADSSLSSKYDVAYGRFELGIKNRRAPGSKTKW